MRLHDLFEAQKLTRQQAARLIADDDELWDAVVEYVTQFESGLAEKPEVRARFSAILARTERMDELLWRGECRENWKEAFGRGYHSWTYDIKVADLFQRSCGPRGHLLVINKPVRALPLSEIVYARHEVRGETHYSGQQAEVFVYDPDAMKVAFETDLRRAEIIIKNRSFTG